jgi:hypothetical protein
MSDNKYLNESGLSKLWELIKDRFQEKGALGSEIVSIEVIDSNSGLNYSEEYPYHFGRSSEDVEGVSYDSLHSLFIHPDTDVIYFHSVGSNGSKTRNQICRIYPIGNTSFTNGKRITLIGSFSIIPSDTSNDKSSIAGVSTEFVIDPYQYSRNLIGKNSNNITEENTVNFNGYAPGTTDSVTESLEDQDDIDKQFKKEFIYWNRKWYSCDYNFIPTANSISYGNYYPVTSDLLAKQGYVDNQTLYQELGSKEEALDWITNTEIDTLIDDICS